MREGTKNGRAKLTDGQVKMIREQWQMFGGRQDTMMGPGHHHIVSAKKLADEHGVATSTMDSIIRRQTWRHLK